MRTAALGELSELIDYGVTASASIVPVGPKFLRITDIQDDQVDWSSVPYCEGDERKLKSSKLLRGDIVFARTGATTGKSFLIRDCPEDAVFASYLIRVRAGKNLDPLFLSHYFQSEGYWSQILLKAAGAAQPGVNSTKLSELQIPLPPLDEQKRIAAILDQADSLRRLRQRSLDRLNTLSQAIFYEMFGAENRAGELVINTVKLSTVCKKITDGTHQAPKWSDSGIPFIFVSNVRNQKISFETNKWVSEDTYSALTKHSPIERWDILYTAVGSYGHAAVVDTTKPFLFQRHIAHIKPDTNKIDPIFLTYCMESKYVKIQADKLAKGVAQKTVTLSDIKNFHIPLPSLEAQRKFVSRVLRLQVLHKDKEHSQIRLNSLFASLQHRAFRGEL